MSSKKNHFLLCSSLWLIILAALFLYSFTQIDLGLTLTEASFWQVIQKNFQYIGYFDRPLSSALYFGLILVMFGYYLWLVKKTAEDKIDIRMIVKLIFFSCFILFLSYNAFSYDLFNYIFDAKIFTYYRLNPYLFKALDFPADPMLGFMHWTHRVFPYGPFWLFLSIVVSYMGIQKLILTMVLFKFLAIAGYLLSCYSIYKIMLLIEPNKAKLSLVIFAFNPLIVIECLVSAHNDIVMIGLVLFALFLFLQKKAISWLFLLLSAGVKFATVVLLPVYAAYSLKTKWERTSRRFFLYCGLLTTISFIAVSLRSELQPWYLVYLIPFAVLSGLSLFFWPVMVLSFGLLLHYLPYLLTGAWNDPIPLIKNYITLASIIIGVLFGLADGLKRKQIVYNQLESGRR